MPYEPPTIGEIIRRLDRIEADMRKDRDHAVSLNTYQAERTHDRERTEGTKSDMIERISSLRTDLVTKITEIEESLKWARRAAATGLIIPLVFAITVLALFGRSPL